MVFTSPGLGAGAEAAASPLRRCHSSLLDAIEDTAFTVRTPVSPLIEETLLGTRRVLEIVEQGKEAETRSTNIQTNSLSLSFLPPVP